MAEPEANEYRAANSGVPVHVHQGLNTIGAIRQEILDRFLEPCIVMIDDDLKCVRPLVGSRRRAIREPSAIWTIVTNGYQCARDADVSVFGWNRNPNSAFLNCCNPLYLTAPCAGAFGIVGRSLRFDPTLNHGEDVDLTMQALLYDRFLICDGRFYFDFGVVGKGSGGLQGKRSDEQIETDISALSNKWGRNVDLRSKPRSAAFNSGGSRSRSMRIAVKRKSN